jgi:hypothetical protein
MHGDRTQKDGLIMPRNEISVDIDAFSSLYTALDDEPEVFGTIDDWQQLVEQIAELEELIEEARNSGNEEAMCSIRELEGLLARKREHLKLFNIG